MVNGSIAKECGQRLRRVRMARNMSQQELAEKLYTTAQNISKYEKEGISNIDTINKINETLDCNLLKDEVDVEGTIGEIGKQILCVLVEHNGFIEVDSLIEKYMFGLDSKQITKEIIKLENIGLCVREQYVGPRDDNHDGLFITAKGIISLKNNYPALINSIAEKEELSIEDVFLNGNTILPEKLQAYEQVVSANGYVTYQDIIDTHQLERLIYKLPKNSSYRTNEIWFLRRNYLEFNWLGKLVCEDEFEFIMERYGDFISSEEVYTDILHRMILGLSNELLERIVESYHDGPDTFETADCIRNALILKYSPYYERYRNYDDIEWRAISHFRSISDWYNEYITDTGVGVSDYSILCDEHYMSLDKDSFSKQDVELANEYEKLAARNDEEFEVTDVLFEYHLEKMAKEKESLLVTEWFTQEEFEAFITENMGPAKTEEEKAVDEQLKEIYKICPEAVATYFRFPQEWEENGLADLVRKNCNLFD